MAATAEDDDFSFPATTAVPPPHFMESPPLWRRPAHQNDHPELNFSSCSSFQELIRTRSNEEKFNFCSVQELAVKPKSYYCYGGGDYEEDERMDVLWEDLNEDSSRINCVKMAAETNYCDIAINSSSPGRAVQVRCIEAWRFSRSKGHRKKPKILLFIKILKKVIVHRNSRCSIKKRTW